MAINTSLLTIAPALQQFFVNKDTGLPLAGGKVYFYVDNSRSTLQPVYGISGSPPSYIYAPLSNPVVLDQYGKFPEVIYYYPYDADEALSLYYIKVYDSTGTILQNTYEAYPNIVATEGPSNSVTVDNNYIPNGQFAYHNLVGGGTNTISSALTPLAPGGHYFKRPSDSVALQTAEFVAIPNSTTNPPANPRYYLKITQSGTILGANDYVIRFTNVNRFASATQKYTISFSARAEGASSLDLDFRLYKYYGTGGSGHTDLDVHTFTLTSTFAKYPYAFVFGSNSGETIVSDDSYVELTFRLPDSAASFSITNVMLLFGDLQAENPDYPETTNFQDAYKGVAGSLPLPASDGSSLYLPIIYKATGFDFDDSQIGNIEIVSYETVPVDSNSIPTTNRLINDGASYDAEGYSALNIPYSRLRDKLYDSTLKCLRYGTGKDFVTATILTGEYLLFVNNTGGVVTASDAGDSGFTLTATSTGVAKIAVKSALYDSASIIVINDYPGSTFVWTAPAGTPCASGPTTDRNTATTASVVVMTMNAGASISNDARIQCQAYDGGTVDFYLNFSVNGAAVTGGGTGTQIIVRILSTDTAAIVAKKTVAAFSQKQGTMVQCSTAAASLGGKYFTFFAKTQASTQKYAVWFNLNSGSTQPVVSGSPAYIEVAITTGETTANVADAIRVAINKRMVGVPDPRGLFLRVYGGSSNVDPNSATRFDYQNPFLYGGYIGTYELDSNLYWSHTHTYTFPDTDTGVQGGGAAQVKGEEPSSGSGTTNAATNGGPESTPRNFYVNTATIY